MVFLACYRAGCDFAATGSGYRARDDYTQHATPKGGCGNAIPCVTVIENPRFPIVAAVAAQFSSLLVPFGCLLVLGTSSVVPE